MSLANASPRGEQGRQDKTSGAALTGALDPSAVPSAATLPKEFDPAVLFLLKECQDVLKPHLTESLRQLFADLTGLELRVIWHQPLPGVCSPGFSRSNAAPPRPAPIRKGPSRSDALPPEGGTTNRTAGPSVATGGLHKPHVAPDPGSQRSLLCPRARALAESGKPPTAACQQCHHQHWPPTALASDSGGHFTGACGTTNLRLPVRHANTWPLTLVVQARITRTPRPAIADTADVSANAALGPRPVPGRSASKADVAANWPKGSPRMATNQPRADSRRAQAARLAPFPAAARGDRTRSGESPRHARAEALLCLIHDNLAAALATHFSEAHQSATALRLRHLEAENTRLRMELHRRIPQVPATSAGPPPPHTQTHTPSATPSTSSLP